jgi:trimeric autotransporter adhesin
VFNVDALHVGLGQGAIARGNGATALGAAGAYGDFSTAMGYDSKAVGQYSIAGGEESTASGYASVALGALTVASAPYATAMGKQTQASGNVSTAFGLGSTAAGVCSFAAGLAARAVHDGTFVWNDFSGGSFSSTAANQFLIQAAGGVGIGTNNPQTALHVAGTATADVFQGQRIGLGITPPAFAVDVQASQAVGRFISTNAGYGSVIELRNTSGSSTVMGALNFNNTAGTYPGQISYNTDNTLTFRVASSERMRIDPSGNVGIGTGSPGAKLHVVGNIFATGTITPNSDRNAKTGFAPVDTVSVLDRLTRLPVQEWRFRTEAEDVKHLGPMAQDFRAAFGLGELPTAIATVDADGVALAAIQGLNRKLEERAAALERELKVRTAEIRELQQSVKELKMVVGGR